jgi:HAE1 family hydrophobic/amphiphilic exporter-1
MNKAIPAFLLLAFMAAAQTTTPAEPKSPTVPALEPLKVPPRIGVFGEAHITLDDVIGRVLENDRQIQVSRIQREEAGFNIKAAKGYFDPQLGLNAYRLKSVTPIASLIGGAANGKLTQKELYADPSLSGNSPWFGSTYKLDFASARQSTDSTFVTLNPQYPSSLNLTLTQPLWQGLSFDANRHRLLVARKNQQISDEQLRQSVIEVMTQAIQAYWELDFAYRNLAVQIEAVRLAEQQDASNRRQVEQGLLAPVDVVQTQTQVATYQVNVFTAQENLTRAENALKQLMLPNRQDLMWGVALVPDTPVNRAVEIPTLENATKRALMARPELAESALSIEVNKLDTRLSREEAKPQVNAYASLSLQGLAGSPLPPGPNPFTAGLGSLAERLNDLSILAGLPPVPSISFGGGQIPPIFVGGYGQSITNLTNTTFPTAQVGVRFSLPLRNRTANANAAISAAEGKRLSTQREQLAMSIESDVRNSLQAVASARARLDAAELARRSAEEQYASEQRQFQAGTSSVFLVLQRQTELINARSRELRSVTELGRAQADMDRATAGTLEAHGIRLAKP